MTPEATELLNMYNDLIGIRNRGAFRQAIDDFIGKPTHTQHEQQYLAVQSYAMCHWDAVIELITTHALSMHEITSFLMHGGSVAKAHNPHMSEFFANLDAYTDLLTDQDQLLLQWFHKQHGY